MRWRSLLSNERECWRWLLSEGTVRGAVAPSDAAYAVPFAMAGSTLEARFLHAAWLRRAGDVRGIEALIALGTDPASRAPASWPACRGACLEEVASAGHGDALAGCIAILGACGSLRDLAPPDVPVLPHMLSGLCGFDVDTGRPTDPSPTHGPFAPPTWLDKKERRRLARAVRDLLPSVDDAAAGDAAAVDRALASIPDAAWALRVVAVLQPAMARDVADRLLERASLDGLHGWGGRLVDLAEAIACDAHGHLPAAAPARKRLEQARSSGSRDVRTAAKLALARWDSRDDSKEAPPAGNKRKRKDKSAPAQTQSPRPLRAAENGDGEADEDDGAHSSASIQLWPLPAELAPPRVRKLAPKGGPAAEDAAGDGDANARPARRFGSHSLAGMEPPGPRWMVPLAIATVLVVSVEVSAILRGGAAGREGDLATWIGGLVAALALTFWRPLLGRPYNPARPSPVVLLTLLGRLMLAGTVVFGVLDMLRDLGQ